MGVFLQVKEDVKILLSDRYHIEKEINSTVLLSMDTSSRQASEASPVRHLVPNLYSLIIFLNGYI